MKSETRKITNTLLNHVEYGSGIRYIDTDIKGFQAWIGASSISFFLRKRNKGKEYAIKIGCFPDISVQEARTKALSILSSLSLHGKPDMSKHAIPTVYESFVEHIGELTRKNTIHAARTGIKHFISLYDIKITDLKEDVVRSVFESIESKMSANVGLAFLKSSIRRSCEKYKIEFPDIFRNIKMNVTKARENYIKKEDACKFFDAIRNTQCSRYSVQCDIIKMMVFTGAREMNVIEMRFEEISNDGIWTIPSEKFKGKRIHRIALGKNELEIISKYRKKNEKNGFVFGNEGQSRWKLAKTMNIICEKSCIGHFQLRDLRRTIGSWMLSHGVPIAVVSQKLGHASIAITERVYAHVLPEFSVEATESTIRRMLGENINH